MFMLKGEATQMQCTNRQFWIEAECEVKVDVYNNSVAVRVS